jgi:hypothetical protein
MSMAALAGVGSYGVFFAHKSHAGPHCARNHYAFNGLLQTCHIFDSPAPPIACGLARRRSMARDGYSSNLAVKPIPRVRRRVGFISSRIAESWPIKHWPRHGAFSPKATAVACTDRGGHHSLVAADAGTDTGWVRLSELRALEKSKAFKVAASGPFPTKRGQSRYPILLRRAACTTDQRRERPVSDYGRIGWYGSLVHT